MPIDSTIITQIAIVVDDIEATAANYAKLLGLPMPDIQSIPPFAEIPAYYRDQPAHGEGCRLCVFQMGNTVLELVQPDLTRPNSWKDWYDRNGGPGVQHIGFVVKDRDGAITALEEMGATPYHIGYYPDMSYTFVDAVKPLGVELNIKQFGLDNGSAMDTMRASPDKSLTQLREEGQL